MECSPSLEWIPENQRQFFEILSSPPPAPSRIKCLITGHEIPSSKEQLYSFLASKRYNSALKKEISIKQYEPYILPSPLHADKLVCTLSGKLLSKSEDAILRHMMGKKFQFLLAMKEEEIKKKKKKANGDMEMEMDESNTSFAQSTSIVIENENEKENENEYENKKENEIDMKKKKKKEKKKKEKSTETSNKKKPKDEEDAKSQAQEMGMQNQKKIKNKKNKNYNDSNCLDLEMKTNQDNVSDEDFFERPIKNVKKRFNAQSKNLSMAKKLKT